MKQLLSLLLCAVVFISCKPTNENNQGAGGYDFTSIRQFDVDANYLGNVGNATDDYTQEEWPQWVLDLFAPLDTVSRTGYVQSDCSIDALYPNPSADTQTIRLFATQPVNLKVAVIDVNKHVYFLRSYHVPSTIQKITFHYDSTMAAATHYRMFYGFSSETKPFFMRGHIDIHKIN